MYCNQRLHVHVYARNPRQVRRETVPPSFRSEGISNTISKSKMISILIIEKSYFRRGE
jgi:hypothetical protein